MIFLIFTFIFTVWEGPRAYPTHTLDPSLVLKILVKKIIHRLSTLVRNSYIPEKFLVQSQKVKFLGTKCTCSFMEKFYNVGAFCYRISVTYFFSYPLTTFPSLLVIYNFISPVFRLMQLEVTTPFNLLRK